MDAEEARHFYEVEYYPLYSGPVQDGEGGDRWTLTEEYVKEREELASQRLKLLSSWTEVRGKRVLDVGCGTGGFLKLAADAGAIVHGVEVAPDHVAFARERYGLSISSGTFEEFLATNDQPFDIVTLFHALEHLSSPTATLRGVRSILRDDGLLCLQVPNVLHSFAGLAQSDMYMVLRGAHLYNFTPRSLRNVLAKAGFQIRALQPVETRYLFAIAYPSAPRPLRETDGFWKMLLYFKAWQLWTNQRRWRRRARAGAKTIAFALLGEARVRRWVTRIRGT